MKKTTVLLSIILALCLFATGCGNNATNTNAEGTTNSVETETTAETETDASGLSYDGSLKITGVDGDFEVAFNDIFNTYEAVTESVHSISSSGEEFDDEVTGVLLNTILAEHGASQADFTTIRLIAGDGYEVTVPAEIVAEKDIILAYDFNGEGLEEKKQPLRAAIDDVRSMYFVSNLMEISFSNEAVAESAPVRDIVFLETAVLALEAEEYVYYENTDMAVTVADLLELVGCESEADVAFMAADGYEKTETMDIFKDGYIKFTGEDAPMFLDPEIQKGMYIKYIMKADAGDKTFVSVLSAMSSVGQTKVNGKVGVAMVDFFDLLGIDADAYVVTAIDGYEMEIGKDNLADGVFYIHDETGNIGMKFTEDYEKNWSVKDILTIKPLGTTAVTSGDAFAGEEAEVASGEWMVTFEGLEDGSFDFTSEKASQKMTLVELHTEREKNDEKKPEDWTGYTVTEILDWLHVESYSSLTIEAADGYQVEIPASEINEESILAIKVNGEAVEAEFLPQFVQNTQFATTWVKGVVKIIVNP